MPTYIDMPFEGRWACWDKGDPPYPLDDTGRRGETIRWRCSDSADPAVMVAIFEVRFEDVPSRRAFAPGDEPLDADDPLCPACRVRVRWMRGGRGERGPLCQACDKAAAAERRVAVMDKIAARIGAVAS